MRGGEIMIKNLILNEMFMFFNEIITRLLVLLLPATHVEKQVFQVKMQ